MIWFLTLLELWPFSNYANQANDYAKDILNRIEVYITIIDSLDIPITAVEITPTTLDFWEMFLWR